MRIGIDIMGGDFAPRATTLGAILALKELSQNDKLVLIGNKNTIEKTLQEEQISPEHFDFLHTEEVIEMGEHPTKALTQKPKSSIALGFNALKENELDAFASAGNTGAMLVGSMFSVKPIQGIIRPALISYIPKEKGGFSILIDVGANADCKPEVLLQFAILGSLFSEMVLGKKSPKVGLLNIGEEEEKGNLLTQATYPLLKENNAIHFIGNVEGRDLFNGKADVIVCDGFTGNIVLKMAESFHNLTVGRGIQDGFFEQFDYENYGGTPILGVNAPVIVGHGISNEKAIKNMILLARDLVNSGLTEKIKSTFS